MHSSRMRTARSSSRLLAVGGGGGSAGGVCPGGVYRGEGVSAGGVCIPACTEADILTEFLTQACENITFTWPFHSDANYR